MNVSVDDLVTRLSEKLRRAVSQDSLQQLLEPDVDRDLSDLWTSELALLRDGRTTGSLAVPHPHVLGTLGAMHYMRSLARPVGSKGQDLLLSSCYFAPMFVHRSQTLPPPVYAILLRMRHVFGDAFLAAAPERPHYWHAGEILSRHFTNTGPSSGISGYIAEIQQCNKVASPRLAEFLLNYCSHVAMHASRGSAPIDDAVHLARAAVAAAEEVPRLELHARSALGNALRLAFEQTRQPTDLQESISQLTLASRLAEAEPDGPLAPLANLGVALRVKGQFSSSCQDVIESVRILGTVISSSAPNDAGRRDYLYSYGLALQAAAGMNCLEAETEDAVAVLTDALALEAGNYPTALFYLLIAKIRLADYVRGGPLASIESAVASAEAAIIDATEDHREEIFRFLGRALLALSEAKESPGESEMRAQTLSSLLHTRYRDNLNLRQAALEGLQTGLSGTTESNPSAIADLETLDRLLLIETDKAATDEMLSFLSWRRANCLRILHLRTGRREHLDDAIAILRSADAQPQKASQADRAGCGATLGSCLLIRYRRDGDLDTLSECISRFEASDSEALPIWQRIFLDLNFGAALQERFRRTENRSDLDRAIELLREAVLASSRDYVDRNVAMTNLASALMTSYSVSGDPVELEAAITNMRSLAHDLNGDGSHDSGNVPANLCRALTLRFERTSDPADLEEAIRWGKQAVDATPATNPNLTAQMLTLGQAMQLALHASLFRVTWHAVGAIFRECASTTVGPLELRCEAARQWGELAAADRDWQEATAAYELAVEFSLALSSWGRGRQDYAYYLSQYAGVVRDAAACALNLGDGNYAVSILEWGRGVLSAQRCGWESDLELLETVDSHLAERFRELRASLVQGGTREPLTLPDSSLAEQPDSIYSLTVQWHRLLDEIRAMPGLQDFLRSPQVEDLRQEAAQGPIVVLNISRFRADAIVVLPEQIAVVPLEKLHEDEARRRAVSHLRAADEASNDSLPAALRSVAEDEIRSTLRWCLEVALRPIQEFLLKWYGDRLPGRVWLCPTGILSFLPLHAAWGESAGLERDDEASVGAMLPSYTATIRMLRFARNRLKTADRRRAALIVAVANAPGASPIQGAREEAVAVKRHCDSSAELLDADATTDAVATAMTQWPRAHFACHAAANVLDASLSGLLLYDRLLTLDEIVRLPIGNAAFAFLSACSTNVGDWNLADEALTIVSAFQMAGYPQVVGTLWPVLDRRAVEVAEQFYSTLSASRHIDTDEEDTVVQAYKKTFRALRTRYPDTPSVWAGYVHAGA